MKHYPIKSTFNLDGFLRACRTLGIKLYSETDGEVLDGGIETSLGILTVSLKTETPEALAIVEAQIPLFDDGQPSPAKVPASVTPRQIRLALVQSGISLASIDAIIAAMPEPDQTLTRVNWEYAIEISRTDPLIDGVGALMGLTPSQIDDLFILAGTFP